MRFFRIVQDAASELGKVFFLWAEEGNPLMSGDMDGGDLSGWLVNESDAARFDSIWRKTELDLPGEFDDAFCIARWSRTASGEVKIWFE